MRRSRSTLVVVLVLTALTLITLDVRAGEGSPFDGARRTSDAALGRAQSGLAGVVDAVTGAADRTSEQERRLRAENARLTAELSRSAGLQRRVDELDALLQLPAVEALAVVPARVSALGSAFGFADTATIDAGSDDGVEAGQTVVNGAGLVGRVVRAGPFSATVLLLTDPGFTAGARLAREGAIGLAVGDGSGGVQLTLVQGGQVQADDALLTTGSGTFVPGVPIGRVTTVDAPPGSLVVLAAVTPFAAVGSLDLVGVVTEPPRSTPRVPLEPSAP